eukprot:CAMPEP_0116873704 /NCGR_PEP_ID=MMETSP0463-20121206/4969_1 /TAXON_ID=181622 /ORGANISM="Strombidinopsis sp, Strain SopsisLIS2011" /LENGTH=32 /DNA_ID= /DNA_START= /DNA_END= /DNA_ORIENTATION=
MKKGRDLHGEWIEQWTTNDDKKEARKEGCNKA